MASFLDIEAKSHHQFMPLAEKFSEDNINPLESRRNSNKKPHDSLREIFESPKRIKHKPFSSESASLHKRGQSQHTYKKQGRFRVCRTPMQASRY